MPAGATAVRLSAAGLHAAASTLGRRRTPTVPFLWWAAPAAAGVVFAASSLAAR